MTNEPTILYRKSSDGIPAWILSQIEKRLLGKTNAVFVELAYLDSREGMSPARSIHVHQAVQLFDMLISRCSSNAMCHVNVFENDLSESSICGSAACDEAGSGALAISKVLHREDLAAAHSFGMRNTRNRATKSLKQAIKRGLTDGIGITLERSASSGFDIAQSVVAHTEDGPVHLGIVDKTSGRVIPRCTLIMAQHYADILRKAQELIPSFDNIVIVDYNRHVERDRVAAGASATFALHEWPANLRSHIINVVHFEESDVGWSLRVTTGGGRTGKT